MLEGDGGRESKAAARRKIPHALLPAVAVGSKGNGKTQHPAAPAESAPSGGKQREGVLDSNLQHSNGLGKVACANVLYV